MKHTIVFFFFLFSASLYSQGELLDKGESGVALYYSSTKLSTIDRIDPRTERGHSLGFSFVGKRVFEGGFNIFKINNDLNFSPYIAGYVNTPSALNLKVFTGYNFQETDENFLTIGGTLFIDSQKIPWLVPSFTVSHAEGRTSFIGGLDFVFGNALHAIGGIHVTKPLGLSVVYGFNIGILFSTSTQIIQKDI